MRPSIPPRERYSTNEASVGIPPELLVEVVRRLGMDPAATDLQRLSGGFMNANYLAATGERRLVIRIYSTDVRTARREFDVLRFLEPRRLPTPRVQTCLEAHGRPVVAMEYLDGETLEERLARGAPCGPELYEAIGAVLGRIHHVRFDEAGFLGPGVAVGREYREFAPFLRDFIEKTLTGLEKSPERLDVAVNRRCRRLVDERWAALLPTEPRRQLVHTDFNPKNVMVARGDAPQVVGVLDWEFCLSGNGLIDLGNFFRFAGDYCDEAPQAFAKGYRSVNADLPDDWEDLGRLLDLGNMCSFLERREDYQRSFATARAVIAATLDHFGY